MGPDIFFADASIDQTPDGFVLKAPLLLNEHAAPRFKQRLLRLVKDPFVCDVKPTEVSTSGVKPGSLVIGLADLSDRDGVAFRVSLQIAAKEAREEGAADEARIAKFLGELGDDD